MRHSTAVVRAGCNPREPEPAMNILYDERVDGALPKVDKAALLAELQAQLPDLDILHRSEDLKPYECDGLSASRTTPRSEARRVGKECVSTCRSRWSPDHKKKKKK